MKFTALAAVVAASATLITVGATTASAAPVSAQSIVCVQENNVIYRKTPEGTPLGQVHRGRRFDVFESGGPDLTWAHGNIDGGRAGVWIYWGLLGNC